MRTSAPASEIQPLTFHTLPWVALIDDPSVSDEKWMETNPDGQWCLKTIQYKRPAIIAIAALLRNVVRLMLRDPWKKEDECYTMMDLLELAQQAPDWQNGQRTDVRQFFGEDFEALRTRFPSAPLTLDHFVCHFQADADHYCRNAQIQP